MRAGYNRLISPCWHRRNRDRRQRRGGRPTAKPIDRRRGSFIRAVAPSANDRDVWRRVDQWPLIAESACPRGRAVGDVSVAEPKFRIHSPPAVSQANFQPGWANDRARIEHPRLRDRGRLPSDPVPHANHPEAACRQYRDECWGDSGAEVSHAHVHLIPRRPGDVEKPRGGVRGVVPGTADY